MPIFAISKISTLLQTSVAEQTGLRLTWSQYPKADFLMSWLIFVCVPFQKELQKNMVEVVYPKFLATFEKGLETNGGKYFVGDSVSVKQYVLDPSLNLKLKVALRLFVFKNESLTHTIKAYYLYITFNVTNFRGLQRVRKLKRLELPFNL